MKKSVLLLIVLILTGCSSVPYTKKDGTIVFDSTGTSYRLRSKNIYNAKELYYLDKLDIRMSTIPSTISKDPFK